MVSRLVAACVALALVAAALPARAQDAEQQAEFRRNCTADYSRLCSAYSPDSAEVRQCFQQRFKELSPRCQATITKYNGAAGGRRR